MMAAWKRKYNKKEMFIHNIYIYIFVIKREKVTSLQ